MSTKNHTVVLILAAGKASRMGRPKQLLKWKNTNLLQHTINTAKAANPLKIILILGAYHDQILNELDTNGITVHFNSLWQKGMGQSLAFGLKKAIIDFNNLNSILILLADQPLITINHIKKIMSSFKPHQQQIITTSYLDRTFAAPTLFDSYYFTELLQLKDDIGAKEIIKKHFDKVKTIPSDNPYSDIDTWQDYKDLNH